MYALKRVQETKALEQSRIQRDKKQEDNDSILISQQALQATQATSTSNPLDSLVSAGTITQDQADAIQSVFQSGSKQIQSSGTYSNKTRHQNPLDSLVTSGTITQDQKNEIQSTLKSAIKANRSSDETTSAKTRRCY